MKKLIALITGGKLVWLEDFDGEVTKSIAYKTGFGKLKAKRMPGSLSILLPDGSVQKPNYVKRWEYVE